MKRPSESPPSFFALSDRHLERACREIHELTYYGRYDSLHCHKVMTSVERRFFHELLVETKEKEAAEYEKAAAKYKKR